jgi:hypothetical protein
MKNIAALLLVVGCGVAQAQVYNFDLTINSSNVFDGTIGPGSTADVGGLTLLEGGPQGGELIDLEGAPSLQAAGSEIFTLNYTVSGTKIVDAFYDIDGQFGPTCGPEYTRPPGGGVESACSGSITPVAKTMAAPELDGSHALGALTLLAAGVLVLKGRPRT